MSLTKINGKLIDPDKLTDAEYMALTESSPKAKQDLLNYETAKTQPTPASDPEKHAYLIAKALGVGPQIGGALLAAATGQGKASDFSRILDPQDIGPSAEEYTNRYESLENKPLLQGLTDVAYSFADPTLLTGLGIRGASNLARAAKFSPSSTRLLKAAKALDVVANPVSGTLRQAGDIWGNARLGLRDWETRELIGGRLPKDVARDVEAMKELASRHTSTLPIFTSDLSGTSNQMLGKVNELKNIAGSKQGEIVDIATQRYPGPSQAERLEMLTPLPGWASPEYKVAKARKLALEKKYKDILDSTNASAREYEDAIRWAQEKGGNPDIALGTKKTDYIPTFNTPEMVQEFKTGLMTRPQNPRSWQGQKTRLAEAYSKLKNNTAGKILNMKEGLQKEEAKIMGNKIRRFLEAQPDLADLAPEYARQLAEGSTLSNLQEALTIGARKNNDLNPLSVSSIGRFFTSPIVSSGAGKTLKLFGNRVASPLVNQEFLENFRSMEEK